MRTHYCGKLDKNLVGEQVTICGWVHSRRDHGGVIFLDMRDIFGIAQAVFNPENVDVFALADKVRSEYLLKITGTIRLRPEGATNPNMISGEVELLANQITVLNTSETPPFPLGEYSEVGEEARLKFRFLDLRRPEIAQKLKLRAQITNIIRNFLSEHNFLDIETPLLTKETPEGARDYLVPSRTHAGKFFALPQSPQLFKQLLMVAGFDRYYQIAKCFRDEDLRADRQPEFTQVDIETSFLNEEQIMQIAENLMRNLFQQVLNIDLGEFPKMSFSEAMRRFGSDKPDLRIKLELVDIADLMQDVEFKVFRDPANNPNCRVSVLCVPNCADMPRSQIDGYTKFVASFGAKGLAYIKVVDISKGIEGLNSPILKFIPFDVVQQILTRTNAQNGDLLFFGADTYKIVSDSLGALRVKLGSDLNLIADGFKPLWVVDFPMFEADENGKLSALHHPFTAPSCTASELKANPTKALSRAYDMVLNGTELGGGSIRIYHTEMQQAVFDVLGIGIDEQQDKFGFLLEALKYGAPPHGGLAFGLDRLIMLMSGANSIREVIAFPKTQSAADLMTNAPSAVAEKLLRELHIKTRSAPKIAGE